jgi:formiminotetrahydrofolate cyclodeaminase
LARLLLLAGEIGETGNKNARSDANVARMLARAAVLGMLENVRVNLESLNERSLGADVATAADTLEKGLEIL